MRDRNTVLENTTVAQVDSQLHLDFALSEMTLPQQSLPWSVPEAHLNSN